jgi:hypothetical protein
MSPYFVVQRGQQLAAAQAEREELELLTTLTRQVTHLAGHVGALQTKLLPRRRRSTGRAKRRGTY